MSRTGAKTHRVDANAPEIIRSMRSAGISVWSTAQVGGGFPDAVWYYRGRYGLIEFKMPGEALNAQQREWHSRCAGKVFIVTTAEEAVRLVVESVRPGPVATPQDERMGAS